MVLLKDPLQPGACIEGVHGQTHQRVALGGCQSQGIVQAELRIGAAEAFSVLEVIGSQFDPGTLVTHQWAAFSTQAFQFAQGERDAADHQFPAPVEALAQGEAPGPLGQFRFDRQSQAAGQPAGKARRQIDAHTHIAKLACGRAHQHEGFGWGELHRFRCGAFEAPLDRCEHRQGSAHSFQQHFAGMLHGNLSQLKTFGACSPCGTGRQLQCWVRFRLQEEAQGPEFLTLRRCGQLEAGPCRSNIAGHALSPVVAGGG
ncbi:MAG: Uncharacterised protein [Cyanobium sp. ARS6]|nr:MAG: Uncharacterised protein [Cyanobium sp. ARS6]